MYSFIKHFATTHPLTCYKIFGFAVIPSILEKSTIQKYRNLTKDYFDNSASSTEIKNNRIHPHNIVTNSFRGLLRVQLVPRFIEVISTIFSSPVAVEQSLQLYFNVDYAGWHIDAGSQLRHLEYNNITNKYAIAKVGLNLNSPSKSITPTIQIIPLSNLLPKSFHKFIHILLFKIPICTYILDLFSLSLDSIVLPGDIVLFNHFLWHRSSSLSRRTYSDFKCFFYFEAGSSQTINSHIVHNAIRSLFIEDIKQSSDIFWCSYLGSSFNKSINDHTLELSKLGIETPHIRSQVLVKYLDSILETKNQKNHK